MSATGSLRQRVRLNAALNDLDVEIHAKRAPEEILQAALDGFVDALGAEFGDIKLRDGDDWLVSYEHGFGPAEVGRRLHSSEAPVAERVARVAKPVTVRDYLAEPSGFYVGFPRAHRLRATLATPLIARDEVIGCLFAWMRSEPREFTAEEIDFARRVATSVALALENARLLEAEQSARLRAEAAEARVTDELARTRILLEASDALTSSTDPDELCERLGRVVTEASGIDRVFVNLVDTERQLLTPKVASGGLVRPGGRVVEFERLSAMARRAIAERKTVLLDYDGPDVPAPDRAIARANRARLVLFVPLVHSGAVIGHIALDQPGERYRFTAEQIRIVDSIAASAAVALQNAQLFAREHRIAETLQQTVLSPPEDIATLSISWLYQPASQAASVGGDFYEVFEVGPGKAVLAVGDVAGKGLNAARLTGLMRDGIRAYALESDDPAVVLERLNALALRFTPVDRFATAFLGILDSRDGTLHHCGVGHPAALVLGAHGVRSLEAQPGLLGAFPDLSLTTSTEILGFNEVLVLVTDGVTEARRGGELLGERGVIEALGRLAGTSLAELPTALLEAVRDYTGGLTRDDIVILCVGLRPERGSGEPAAG